MTAVATAPARVRRAPVSVARSVVMVVAVVVLVAGAAATVIQGGPALVDVVALPGQLDHGLGSAERYNAAMSRVVQLENVVISELAALDDVGSAVAKVGPSVANLDGQLRAVAARVETATTGPLTASNVAVAQLDGSLRALESQVRALGSPVAGAAAAITDVRRSLDALLAAAQPLGADVSRAQHAGHSAAANAVGP